MNLENAKKRFVELLNNIKSDNVCDFLNWVQTAEQFKCKDNSEVILENIADDIRKIVPFDAVFASENVVLPSIGKVDTVIFNWFKYGY